MGPSEAGFLKGQDLSPLEGNGGEDECLEASMLFWVSRILSELFEDKPREALKFLTSSVFTEKPYRPLDRLEACQLKDEPKRAFDSYFEELKRFDTTRQYEGIKGVLEIFDSFEDEINKIYEIEPSNSELNNENKLYETLKFLTSPVFYGEQYPRPIDRLGAYKDELDRLGVYKDELDRLGVYKDTLGRLGVYKDTLGRLEVYKNKLDLCVAQLKKVKTGLEYGEYL